MSSILRKALWPATLVAVMLMLLGAIGSATAPTAEAAVDDVCFILGPVPFDIDGELDTENGLLLVGSTYLFVIVVEDSTSTVDISIDDEEGDADITAVADTATQAFVPTSGSGVDYVDEADTGTPVGGAGSATTWGTAFLADIVDDTASGNFPGADFSNADFCGTGTDDGLAFIQVTCDEKGDFEITAFVDDLGGATTSAEVTEDYICVADPATMTLTATPNTVESHPAMGNVSKSLLVATVVDSGGGFIGENYEVEWSTTRCVIEGIAEDVFLAVAFVDNLVNFYESTPGNPGLAELFAAYKSSNPASAAAINVLSTAGLTASTTSPTFLNDPAGPPPLRSIAVALLHCDGAAPGVATVTARMEDDQVGHPNDFSPVVDLIATVDVTVVGPPAFITMTAAPSKLVCGEKATILVTVTDAINQKVSDHTRVELITNYGGVIGGTGATLAFPGINPVGPLSSGAAETFGGVATAYLLTSSSHVGAYEVVAAAGGSSLGAYSIFVGYEQEVPTFTAQINGNRNSASAIYYEGNTGVFSTPVVTSQVTVTCTAGAPAVTAPNTGTGTISPPNTGDAGLAAASSSNAMQFVIAGAAAFVLAGLASFGYARR